MRTLYLSYAARLFFCLCLCLALSLSFSIRAPAQSEPFPLHGKPDKPTAGGSSPSPSQSPSPSSPASAKTKGRQAIKVPRPKFFKSLKDAYVSKKEPHLLMILHLPKAGGTGFIELYNRTGKDLALFQFSIEALGQVGEIEFEELPSSWSAAKEVKMATLRELEIRTPRAYDADANDVYPELIIHQTDLTTQKPELSKKKIANP